MAKTKTKTKTAPKASRRKATRTKAPAGRVTAAPARLARRVADLKIDWWRPCTKRLLLIRPMVPGDTYTEVGSFNWAEDVKTKAVAEGWNVTDLDANNATRANIEDALNDVKPHLVIHYDHGSSFTLWGQRSGALEAGIDDVNIGLASGHIVSTVSCYSATGLGPSAITQGVISYVGYTDTHVFWTHRTAEFGVASNAANYALLEGKTVQQAFDAGWAAYDQLYVDLMAAGDTVTAGTALHDRDCLALLGSASSTAPPLCVCSFGHPLHCIRGLPDSSCRYALPLTCLKGQPGTSCVGLPIEVCKSGLPGSDFCGRGLPGGDFCVLGMPNSAPICGKGPDSCLAGPPLIIRDIITDFPVDTIIIDRAKIPTSMRKAFDQLLTRMQKEVQ